MLANIDLKRNPNGSKRIVGVLSFLIYTLTEEHK